MRSAFIHFLSVICLCTFVAGISAEEKKEEVKVDLYELMEAVGKDYKAVYRIVKKQDASKKADALKALGTLRANSVKAKALVPHKAESIKNEEAKKKFIDSYRKEMDVLIANVDKLKKEVESEKWDEALKTIKVMKTHKSDSHDKFQEEEE